MSANLSAVKTAISDSIENNKGILSFPYARDQALVPEAQVGPVESVEYDTTMGRGIDRFLIPVRVYVTRMDEYTGQDELDGFIAGSGPQSIKEAIEDETEWATIAPTGVHVEVARNEGGYTLGGTELLGIEFLVEVYA